MSERYFLSKNGKVLLYFKTTGHLATTFSEDKQRAISTKIPFHHVKHSIDYQETSAARAKIFLNIL